MIFADFHIHSHYSRATSSEMNPQQLTKYALKKGLNLLGTGDITHPKYLQELKAELKEDGSGILRNKDGFAFVLQGEISLIYKDGGKGRKVHLLILSKDFATVDQINDWLDRRKLRRDYDGRPIFGISAPEFTEAVMGISKDNLIVPAHIWTPFFGVLGSESGFDSLQECFKDQTRHIRAVESGLSSDPAMNWRVPFLDDVTIISNSDPHSPWPWRLGRECNAFDCKLDYDEIINAIRRQDERKLKFTIETPPEYGKYHWSGHRNCGIVVEPEKAKKLNFICPSCKQPMTKGVEDRLNELATREHGYKADRIPFYSFVPLSEVIASANGIISPGSKKVYEIYNRLVGDSSEFEILMNAPFDKIEKLAGEKVADTVRMMREGKLKVRPGYDGVYGQMILENAAEKQKTLDKL